MSPLHKPKDLSEMLPKIKQPKTPITQSSMPRDLLAGNSMIQSFRQIWSIGPSRSNKDKKENPSLSSNTKVKSRSSILKKSLQWSLQRWRKWPKPTLAKKSKMPLSPFPPILMTPKDKRPRMLEQSVVSMSWESSTSQRQPLSLMDLIRKAKVKKMFLFSTLVEEHLMSHFCKSTKEFLKWKPLQATPIWEGKTSITKWLTIV